MQLKITNSPAFPVGPDGPGNPGGHVMHPAAGGGGLGLVASFPGIPSFPGKPSAPGSPFGPGPPGGPGGHLEAPSLSHSKQ